MHVGRRGRLGTVSLMLMVLSTMAPTPAVGRVDTLPPAALSERATAEFPATSSYVPDEVIVRFRDGTTASQIASAHARAGASVTQRSKGVPGLQVAELAGGSVASAIARYQAMPEVLYAEPNYRVSLQLTPNDPGYPVSWGLNNTGQTVNGVAGTADADIDAPEAWDVARGSAGVTVAVIDTGIDYTHPDLAGNVWTNAAEAAGTAGVDDDGNGYIDDIHGYDVANNDGDPMDGDGHGTAVASGIAAAGNDALGTVGVSWDATLIAVQFADGYEGGTVADVLEALDYVDAVGADIVNMSYGGWRTFSQAEYDAMAAMTGTLFIVAAGNDGLDIGSSWPGGVIEGTYFGPRLDWFFYPAAYDLANMVVVGASTSSDGRASTSNHDSVAVDVFAPGSNIYAAAPVPTILAPGTTETSIFSDGFASLAGWLPMSWPNDWSLDTTTFVSAPSSVAITGYSDTLIAYLDQDSLLNLAASDYPLLRFRLRYDLEPGADFFTWGVYDPAQPPADQYPELGRVTGDSAGVFKTVLVDLGAYAGRTDIALWFGMFSNDSVSSAAGYDGAWLDDVQVVDLNPPGPGSPYVGDYSSAYSYVDGSSVSAAYASGLGVLLLGRKPALTPAELKTAILAGVDVKAALSGYCATGGRINAVGSLAYIDTAPVAVADSWTLKKNSTLTVPAPGVLANDTDADGDSLVASLVTPPSSGTLTFNADGSFVYTPNPAFFGTVTFTYRASDRLKTSAPATVSIVVPKAPVAVGTPVPLATGESAVLEETTSTPVPAPAGSASETPAVEPAPEPPAEVAPQPTEPTIADAGYAVSIPMAIGTLVLLVAWVGVYLFGRKDSTG